MEPIDEYHPEEQKTFVDKWSRAIYDNGRFTMIPNLLLDNAYLLGITPSELVVLIKIESYRWNTRPSFPSVQALSISTGMSERHITRITSSLVKKGILERVKRRNKTNAYDMRPLIERLDEIAQIIEADNYDPSGGQNSPFEAAIIDFMGATHPSAKSYTNKTNKIKQQNKNIPVIIANDTDLPLIDLDDLDF